MAMWISPYVRAKLLWNTKTDVAASKKEFYETFFGAEAGPCVQAWWDACEEALGKATCHVHEDWLINHVYTTAFAARIHPFLEAARKARMTDDQRARVEAFALIVDNLEAYAAMNEAEMNLDYAKALAASERILDDRRKLLAINSLFVIGRPGKNGKEVRFDRGLKEIAAKTDGTAGTLVAALPLEMKFARDRFNEGVIGEWYAAGFDDGKWGKKDTFYTWDQPGPPEDNKGHDYDGYGWYRGDLRVDPRWAGKPLRLYLGGAINEAWVWVNGDYAGHRPHKLWWYSPHDVDLDVTSLIKPGQRNTIAIRIWNNADIGGLYRRGFLYSPKPEPVAAHVRRQRPDPPAPAIEREVGDAPSWAKETVPDWVARYQGNRGLPPPWPQSPKPSPPAVAGIDYWQATHFIVYRPETAAFLDDGYSPTRVEYRRGMFPALEKVVAAYTSRGQSDREKALALLTKALPEHLPHPEVPPYGPAVPKNRGMTDEQLWASGCGVVQRAGAGLHSPLPDRGHPRPNRVPFLLEP